MILQCTSCGEAITENLTKLKDLTLVQTADGEEYLPKGSYLFGEEAEFAGALPSDVIVNLGDLKNSRPHSDWRRRQGCCGCGGDCGLNLTCIAGHEIGTEYSDCWMPHYAILPQSHVRVIE